MHLPIPPVGLVRPKITQVLSKSPAFPHKPFQISKLNQGEHLEPLPTIGLRDKERAARWKCLSFQLSYHHTTERIDDQQSLGKSGEVR